MSNRLEHPRALAIEGLSNARDLGDLPAADGRVIARGRVYRAELLTQSDEAGIHSRRDESNAASLAELGIRTVIDLRGDAEASATPSIWAEATGGSRYAFPILDGGHGAAKDYVDMLVTGRLRSFRDTDLGAHYINVLEARATTFGAAVEMIADGTPALIHCTEGKDRTGLLVALILGAVGTPDDRIVDDYALTSAWRPDRALAYAPHFEAAGVELADYRALYESPAIAMQMAIDHLNRSYGGAAGYLADRAEVASDTVSRLRAALLVQIQ